MIRKLIILWFLFIFLAGVQAYPQNEPVNKVSADNASAVILSFEKRFKAVDESMLYLKNNNIDSNDIITLYTDAESLFREVKYTSELKEKDYDLAMKFLSSKISVLEEKSTERVLFAKRMNLMYILMVAMGLTIIILMSFYSIYMYSRRK